VSEVPYKSSYCKTKKSNKYGLVEIAISNDFIALMQFGELHIDKKYYPIWREQKDAWV